MAHVIAEGTEITTHQHVINKRPQLRDGNGEPIYAIECAGVLRVEPGDTGRGPVLTCCDVCGYPMALARRTEFTTPPLVAVGDGVASEDGYARF